MKEQSTKTESRLSWGQSSSSLKTPKRLIFAAWFCTFLSLAFVRTPFIGAIAFYGTLPFGIVLIRSDSKAAKINGWIITAFFAFRFVVLILFGYNILGF